MIVSDDTKLTKAVALSYDRGNDIAPRVVASGKGVVAERIVELAKEAGVHVTKDVGLLELLVQVPIGSEIPPELYQAIAEVLTFVYRLEKGVNQPSRE